MAPRAAVVDLDGTLLHGDTLLPGARDAMAAIRERVEHVVFLTNNPTIPPEAYAARLRDLGVEAAPDEILTACTATIAYLRAHHADDAVFAIAADAIVDQLRDAERDLVADPAAAECVVVGYDPGFDYDDLHAALRALRDGVGFVGTDPDRTIPTADGPIPGSGAIVNAVAGVVERDPDAVLGKPSRETAELLLDRLGVPAEQCVLIGDNPETDIVMGERVGMTTVRVRTGIDGGRRSENEERADHVVADLGAAAALLD
ncbi:phosphoglycolate phosphatase [Halarchaeum acidiphilum MH1-52-1]|uniref:Phosphoglycolate phosphatase n=1 Tax=Halarchaeum acidiphilum MH1-52-1 TaxID=1261545 RepID=U2YF27_9EURY|nr:HAD-IIA family hydrolase [Halarchaeum acidiphilum]GAD52541.1 phosphoglycolate phosphatase [Halarchaeum acidiphilum MH1-52-1]